MDDLYEFGPSVLNCSVVPVGLTEFSKHHLVREPTEAECRAAVHLVEQYAGRARAERGITWAFGADELYLRAALELPPTESYDDFDQVENGVGSVRWLERRVETGREGLQAWSGKRIAVITGTGMARLMPLVLKPLEHWSGARFELLPVVNSLFGPRVTTAGLLPGTAIQQSLRSAGGFDLALIPGEALNDDGLFIDGMSLELLRASVTAEVRPSKDFVDALEIGAAA
jgi:NifB/MoaA-like Fe-S oxidoreductase